MMLWWDFAILAVIGNSRWQFLSTGHWALVFFPCCFLLEVLQVGANSAMRLHLPPPCFHLKTWWRQTIDLFMFLLYVSGWRRRLDVVTCLFTPRVLRARAER